MSEKYVDGVQQFATGTGTGALTLGNTTSARTRRMQDAGIGDGDTIYVRIQHAEIDAEWEIVKATYDVETGQITRSFDDASSSYTGSLISFSAGNKIVSGIIAALGFTPAMADGSAAAPALSFALDTDIGFFRPASDTLGIAAGGVGVASFAAGKVTVDTLFEQNYTNTSVAARPVGQTINLVSAPASAPVSSQHLHGIDIYHTTSGANFNSNNQMYPLEVTGAHSGSDTIYAIRNFLSNPVCNGGGTVTEATAYWARGQTFTGSTITRGYGFHCADWNLNGGTIGTLHGLYVDALTAGSVNYAIYTNAGTVRFGDTTRVDRTTTGVALRASTYTANEPGNLPSSVAVLGTSYWGGSFGGHFTAQNSGTGAYAANIGGSGISLDVGGSTSGPTMFRVVTDGSSGMSNAAVLAVRLAPIINQSATAAYTVLDINPTEAATGSGEKLLINGRIGAGASVFSVDRTGSIFGGGNLALGGYIEGAEQTAPSAPSANGYRIFAQDNGAGKTQLMVLFASGAAQQLAIQP